MNMSRIVLGGVVGGIVFNVVSIVVNVFMLGGRYELLSAAGRARSEPRLPYMPLAAVALIGVGIGLVWLYAAARPRLGAGPKTALLVGLAVGLINGVPHFLAQYSWSFLGGYVSMWQSIEIVVGCTLATVVGAWLYKE